MHIFIQFTFLLINLIYMHDLVIIIIKMCPSMCYYSNGGFSSYTAPIGMKYPRDYKCLHNFCTTQIMMMYSTYIRSFLAKYFSSTYYTGGLIHSRSSLIKLQKWLNLIVIIFWWCVCKANMCLSRIFYMITIDVWRLYLYLKI